MSLTSYSNYLKDKFLASEESGTENMSLVIEIYGLITMIATLAIGLYILIGIGKEKNFKYHNKSLVRDSDNVFAKNAY